MEKTIEGVDESMKPIIGARTTLTKEIVEDIDFRGFEEMEFRHLWRTVIEGSKEKEE